MIQLLFCPRYLVQHARCHPGSMCLVEVLNPVYGIVAARRLSTTFPFLTLSCSFQLGSSLLPLPLVCRPRPSVFYAESYFRLPFSLIREISIPPGTLAALYNTFFSCQALFPPPFPRRMRFPGPHTSTDHCSVHYTSECCLSFSCVGLFPQASSAVDT